jgi:FkbM family methyltransferase
MLTGTYIKIRLLCYSLWRALFYKSVLIPYSDWKSPVYLTFKEKYQPMGPLVDSTVFFGAKVYYQKNDMRAAFNNYWDEESTRIYALYMASKSFGTFDWFDLGSNYGTYSIPFAGGAGGKVLVEPNPFLVTCLRKTFTEKNVHIEDSAVNLLSEGRSDDVDFNLMPFGSGASSLNYIDLPYQVFSICVKSIAIPDLIRKNKKSSVAVIKMDLEGIELNLLDSGLMESFSEEYDDYILFIEYIKNAYSDQERLKFLNHFESYFCIALSDKNYLGGRALTRNESFESSESALSEFYSLELTKGVSNLVKTQVEYADILVFSSEIVANQTLKRFLNGG